MVAPSLEAVVALRPDLVVARTEGTSEDTVTQLDAAPGPRVSRRRERVADVRS